MTWAWVFLVAWSAMAEEAAPTAPRAPSPAKPAASNPLPPSLLPTIVPASAKAVMPAPGEVSLERMADETAAREARTRFDGAATSSKPDQTQAPILADFRERTSAPEFRLARERGKEGGVKDAWIDLRGRDEYRLAQALSGGGDSRVALRRLLEFYRAGVLRVSVKTFLPPAPAKTAPGISVRLKRENYRLLPAGAPLRFGDRILFIAQPRARDEEAEVVGTALYAGDRLFADETGGLQEPAPVFERLGDAAGRGGRDLVVHYLRR